MEMDSILETQNDESFSGFVLYNPEQKSMIKAAEEGKEVHFAEIQIFLEDRKLKYEWMLTLKLNFISAPNYDRRGVSS
jgi:hypothetical protein